MAMRPNRLRQLLNDGKPSLGTHILATWPTITELVGQTGTWDYVEFVAEYAPWTMHDLDNLGRAIELFPNFTGMIKIEQDTRGHLAMRAIGSGIQNLLFSDIRTPDDVRQCVQAVRAEHPEHGGRMGVGSRRDVRTVLHGGSPEYVKALSEAVVCLMIEKKQAVENLEALLAVPGVDMVQFGPADYSMSLGASRATAGDAIREAEDYIFSVCARLGIPPRVELRDASGAPEYVERGIKHFCVGTDTRIYHDWLTSNGQAMRKLLAPEEDLAAAAAARRGEGVNY
jgi:2-keto-3-deoxy-L-rhamnonate aldolase RhmA